MMKRLLFLAALATLACCSDSEHRQAANALQAAAAIVEQQPDSALLLIEAMEPPHHLRHEYSLRHVQARDKADREIAGDTAIFAAADFFVREKNREKAALALFYCGRVHQERGEYDRAAHDYLEADDYAQGSQDYNLQGLINSNLGRLNYERRLFDEATAYYQKALRYFQAKAAKYSHAAWAFVNLGDCFWQNEQPDSALLYYGRGLSIAEQHRDTALMLTIHQCIGAALQEQQRHEQAKQYFRQAEQLGVSPEHRAALYSNLGYTYFELQQADSARRYALQILQLHEQDSGSVAPAELVNTYGLLTAIEEQAGKAKQALQHSKKQNEQLVQYFSAQRDLSILEVQKKYETERLKNENNRLQLEKQRLWVVVLSLMLAVFAIGTGFYLYRERSKKRMEKAQRNIYVLRQLSRSLNEKGNMLNKKERQLREVLVQRLDLLKSISLLEQSLKEKPGSSEITSLFNRQVYKHDEGKWLLLYQAVNELYGGVLDRLRSHSQLDDSELKICCLGYAKLDSTEISAIMNLSIKTIQNKRSSIRRKLDTLPDTGDIKLFLEDTY